MPHRPSPSSSCRAPSTAPSAMSQGQSRALLILVILIALNLRPFLTAIGPLTSQIEESLSLGMGTLAWLTLLPLLLIGVGVLFTPALRHRASARQLLGAALLLLGVGNALRFGVNSGALFIASAALCGLGSALVQGVLPGLVKQAFAHKVPLVMGIFSACLMGAARWGPVSLLMSRPGSAGRRRSPCGACRCCWHWAGSPGGCACHGTPLPGSPRANSG